MLAGSKELIKIVCELLNEIVPISNPYSNLIKFVEDRPGHDFRYAINSSFIKKEIGWEPKTNIIDGLKNTINWYLRNIDWCNKILESSGYEGERLGSN